LISTVAARKRFRWGSFLYVCSSRGGQEQLTRTPPEEPTWACRRRRRTPPVASHIMARPWSVRARIVPYSAATEKQTGLPIGAIMQTRCHESYARCAAMDSGRMKEGCSRNHSKIPSSYVQCSIISSCFHRGGVGTDQEWERQSPPRSSGRGGAGGLGPECMQLDRLGLAVAERIFLGHLEFWIRSID
jgi:hypothetical protein